ncbi:DNA repair protein RecO [Flavobacterium sp. JP2137]|uniref:DNA repair protein RecO n=1 Tax=Flavobacterium sp. JP2137 TaxID=3414510 RepID=UPI003D2FA54B
MLIHTKAVVLSAVKYQEKSLIVKCFTQASGVKSYYIRNAYARGKGAQNNAYFRPLTLLEIEAQHKNKGGLEYIKELKLAHPYQTIYGDFYKNSMATFVSEMLHHTIKEEEPNEPLFEYLEAALLWFDHQEEASNFHLITLLGITKYLGFYPDYSEAEAPFFNPVAGNFTHFQDRDCFEAADTQLFKRLLQHGFLSDQRVFSGRERNNLLNLLLRYYNLHISGFRNPNSLTVLKEIFSD